MSVLALINPQTLLGAELRRALEQRKKLWREIRLLTTEESDEAMLTELAGAAALVQPLGEHSLDGVDVVFLCGPVDPLPALPAGATGLFVGGAAPAEAVPLVAGVNLEAAPRAGLVLSPHPGVVALAHLLHPLRALGVELAASWLVQPATEREQPGMDELMDQTRSLLAFREDSPHDVFGHQLAFNILPAATAEAVLVAQLGKLWPDPPKLAVHLVQGAVFHSFTASLLVVFADDPGLEAVETALDAHPYIRRADSPEHLGPIDAAAQEELLLGAVEPAALANAYWLWGVMDNLTRGGASNALEIAEAILGPAPA